MENTFEIQVDLAGQGKKTPVKIVHSDESFDVVIEDKKTAAILNNGDNSWQIISGDLSQETANLIGEQIEEFYQKKDPLD